MILITHCLLLHGREMTDTGKALCSPKSIKPAVFCWASMLMSTTIGFVYFGMRGALPVYSLQHSRVEGKMTVLHNAIGQHWSIKLPSPDACQMLPSPSSLFTICATRRCPGQFTCILPAPPGTITG